MKKIILVIAGLLLLSQTTFAEPLPRYQWTPEAKLWTARSCAGEAGFDAVEECIAIAWIYSIRARLYSRPYIQIVRQYSSAIKSHEKHRRGWIFGLNLQGKRPRNWPRHLNWKNYKKSWLHILAVLDLWAQGRIPNPVIGADHYGGLMDSPGIRWVRVYPQGSVVFRNRFYRSTSTSD